MSSSFLSSFERAALIAAREDDSSFENSISFVSHSGQESIRAVVRPSIPSSARSSRRSYKEKGHNALCIDDLNGVVLNKFK